MSRVSCSQSWVLKIFLHAAVLLSSEKIIIIFFKVMGKRKRGDANNPIDIVSSTPEDPGHLSKHRTCWLHTVAFLHARKMKISKQKIRNFELTAPCFLGTFSCRRRSKRRVKCKNTSLIKGKNSSSVKCKDMITKRKKNKLDSGKFEHLLDNLWRSFSEDKKVGFTYLDSLWFDLYRKPSSKAKVLTWIKRKHIFSKKYVLVPIVCWRHWNLLILCNFGGSFESKTRTPCMLLLDSLEMSNPWRFEPDIRKFVMDIYKAEDRPETKELISRIPLLVPKVPQQRNGEECGNFVLYFINLFVEGAPENFNLEDYPYFMEKNWFTAEDLDCFCERLNSSEN